MNWRKYSVPLLFLALSLGALWPATGSAQEGPGLELRGTMAVPVDSEPAPATLDVSAGEVWHRATLKLGGSMCPACLLELQGKLRKLQGVAFAKVEREKLSNKDAADGKQIVRLVPAVVIYDAHALGWDKIAQLIKAEKYKSSEIADSPYLP